jgi:hypothetical protein
MGRLRDLFRRKKDKSPINYDLVDESTIQDEGEGWRDRWARRTALRRKHTIERKHAQAQIATHRKWVIMWIAVIVVTIAIVVLTVLNKFSITGLIF